ncbi:transposable element Tcb1 transposase [Trichonephila clavipes]|nr:transposable element Tcb1 transposase [Trichonephila clavipes]
MSTGRMVNGGLFSLRMSQGLDSSGSACVRGGISLSERTDIHVFFHGNGKAQTYRDGILNAYVSPYAGVIGDAFVLQNGNARPHRAQLRGCLS